VQVDKSYGQMDNGFVIAQSLVNFVEVSFILLGLLKRNTMGGFLFVFSYAVMSCSKTVLYMLVDASAGFEFTKHNDLKTWLLLYFIPSAFWIVFPGLIWWHCINKMLSMFAAKQK